jgi:hypothetical protein
MDMSEEAQHERHTQSGKHPLLTEAEETEILRLATAARERHELVDTRWTRTTIALVTDGRIPNATDALISRFWKHAGWPLRRAQARTPQELRPTLQDEADTFRSQVTDYVHEHNIPPANVHVADETGMWNGSVAQRTRVHPGTLDPGLQRKGDNQRDTGMVALSAAGQIDSYFLQHRKLVTRKQDGQTVIVQKGVSGMGTEQMLEWSRGFVERHAPEGESVLLLDRLGAHRNKKVLDTLEAGHVHPFLIPPQASKIISPCDNSFFSSMKARMRGQPTDTTEQKQEAFTRLCAEYDPEEVRRYFHHCGWSF